MEARPGQHGAAGSTLGYLYQVYLPLLLLARRASLETGLTLGLELLDDVQFDQEGLPRDLIQTKHHLESQGNLGDSSDDVWRTINAWISALDALHPDELPALIMVTTAVAPEGSAASYLRDDQNRDPDRAQLHLERAAATSTNKNTAPWRARFAQLDPADRGRLVGSIRVADGATTIDEIDDELRTALFWVLPRADQVAAFIDHVKGWWFGIVIRLLRREIPAFAATDMLRAIQDIRDQFGPDSLPTDPELPDPDEATVAGFQNRVFVRQMQLIAATQQQLAVAIRDYYRAFTQRSRWLRRELVGVDEIDRFERRLVDEWEFVFANLTAEVAADAAEAEKQRCGREVLRHAAETARVRIRERYHEPFLTRGSLHGLADERRIGWHPDFEARLEALLRPVVDAS